MKRFNFIIYLLIAILPLQSIASSNMIICQNTITIQAKAHACHEHDVQINHDKDHSEPSSMAKLHCLVLCGSLCAATAVSHPISLHLLSATQATFTPLNTIYTSTTPQSLLRPPIALS